MVTTEDVRAARRRLTSAVRKVRSPGSVSERVAESARGRGFVNWPTGLLSPPGAAFASCNHPLAVGRSLPSAVSHIACRGLPNLVTCATTNRFPPQRKETDDGLVPRTPFLFTTVMGVTPGPVTDVRPAPLRVVVAED